MIPVYYAQSTNVNGEEIDRYNRALIEEVAGLLNEEMPITTNVDELDQNGFNLVLIGGGGVEGRFKAVWEKIPQPIFLIATGANNSLAASMEILSFLHQQNVRAEIIHGEASFMADRISIVSRVIKAKKKLEHFRVGRVGHPSDWLISSDVDADTSKKQNGIEIVDIDMNEFFEEIKKAQYEDNQYTLDLKAKNYNAEITEKSLQVYGALKRICTKYQLNAVTTRCFDLLGPIRNTGCSALAILNAEGIYAGCEGDTPAVISMAVLGELTGQPVFMANPSRIDRATNNIIFAHCTLPLNMPTSYELMSHFESGLGIAFRGTLPLGDCTVFKCSGLLDNHFVTKGEILENLHEYNLCRTQLRIHLDDVNYFLTKSIGNHHCIIIGDHTKVVEEFFKW